MELLIWYCHIKEFFESRGYELVGEMTIIGEGDPDFEETCKISMQKYQQWNRRVECYGG